MTEKRLTWGEITEKHPDHMESKTVREESRWKIFDFRDWLREAHIAVDEGDGYAADMDDAALHLESIREKNLPVDELCACSHMAIYLRWCMEHDLMDEAFLAEYGEVVQKVRTDPAGVDLRVFIQGELDGCLFSVLFGQEGRAFAAYYYGENDAPCYPADIDDNALRFFGRKRYHSGEFQDEAYLFIPFDEGYYQDMARVIGERFAGWRKQYPDFDKDTLEPSDAALAIMKYLDCACTFFPPMADEAPVMRAYRYERHKGAGDGFFPVLIRPDETLLEILVMNADPESGADCFGFDLKNVAEYRKRMLAAPVRDGKAVLEELSGQYKAEDGEDETDRWDEGAEELEGGCANCCFSGLRDFGSRRTGSLILARIPVKNPWEIFAFLPFGNWNECPDTPELMAAAKYWFEHYGAVPAVMTNDELEFELLSPVPEEKAVEEAARQYGFCPYLDQNGDGSIGALADVLRQSTVWYFWWD